MPGKVSTESLQRLCLDPYRPCRESPIRIFYDSSYCSARGTLLTTHALISLNLRKLLQRSSQLLYSLLNQRTQMNLVLLLPCRVLEPKLSALICECDLGNIRLVSVSKLVQERGPGILNQPCISVNSQHIPHLVQSYLLITLTQDRKTTYVTQLLYELAKFMHPSIALTTGSRL